MKNIEAIVEQLKKIMVKRRTSDDFTFKKVEKNILKVQIDKVNKAIKYLESKSITGMINLIGDASVWVAEQIGFKKAEHRGKNEPRWKLKIEGDIKRLIQEVNFMEWESMGELGLKKNAN